MIQAFFFLNKTDWRIVISESEKVSEVKYDLDTTLQQGKLIKVVEFVINGFMNLLIKNQQKGSFA